MQVGAGAAGPASRGAGETALSAAHLLLIVAVTMVPKPRSYGVVFTGGGCRVTLTATGTGAHGLVRVRSRGSPYMSILPSPSGGGVALGVAHLALPVHDGFAVRRTMVSSSTTATSASARVVAALNLLVPNVNVETCRKRGDTSVRDQPGHSYHSARARANAARVVVGVAHAGLSIPRHTRALRRRAQSALPPPQRRGSGGSAQGHRQWRR